MIFQRLINAISSRVRREGVSLHRDEGGWFTARYGDDGESKEHRISEDALECITFLYLGFAPDGAKGGVYGKDAQDQSRQAGLVGPDTTPGFAGGNLTEDGKEVATQYYVFRKVKDKRFNRAEFAKTQLASLVLAAIAVAVAFTNFSWSFSFALYMLALTIMMVLLRDGQVNARLWSVHRKDDTENPCLTYAVYGWTIAALVSGALSVAGFFVKGIGSFGPIALVTILAAHHAIRLWRVAFLRVTW